MYRALALVLLLTSPALAQVTCTPTVVKTTSVPLKWTAPNPDAGYILTGYKLERKDSKTDWRVIANPPANAITATDSSLANKETYYWRISATYQTGETVMVESIGTPNPCVTVQLPAPAPKDFRLGEVN